MEWRDALFRRFIRENPGLTVVVASARDRLMVLSEDVSRAVASAATEGLPLNQVSFLKSSRLRIGQGAATCGYRDKTYRPLVAGCSTSAVDANLQPVLHIPYTCSLGLLYKGVDGAYYAVSANHCWAGTICGLGPGKYAVQPSVFCGGSYPEDYIGDVVAYTQPVDYMYGLPVYRADAALVRLTEPMYFSQLALWDLDTYVTYTPRHISPVIGVSVTKLGVGEYTYSRRSGNVIGYPAAANIMCPNGNGFILDGTALVSAQVSPGDSGSAMFASNGVLGITTAATEEGYALVTPWQEIINELNIQLAPSVLAAPTTTTTTTTQAATTTTTTTTSNNLLAFALAFFGTAGIIGLIEYLRARRKKKGLLS